MIPSALAGQLRRGLADFLRFSFWSPTPGMEGVVDTLIREPGALFKGPYVSLALPFVRGSNPRYFADVPLPYTPYLHQERAFERLGGRRKLSTLVATGTGSGKTESFLVPILDHSLADANQPGVKAILIYPMNALATDQAGRLARMIHGNDRLRGRVTAGLYIGESRAKKSSGAVAMSATSVITDRQTLQEAPPDILLTNYKMLDYLLLRPGDQAIWRHNGRGTLRFLVVDEIHTFDGAQGTDLACLVRRLKRRLQADDRSLCCVGTSATMGGPESMTALVDYAAKVFGETFDAEAVIGESRLSEEQYLAGRDRPHLREPAAADKHALDPTRATSAETYLARQERLWFDEAIGPSVEQSAVEHAVALGDKLAEHATFHALVHALGGRPATLDELVDRLSRQRQEWREDPELGRLALGSLLALVSAARAWRDELPEVAAARRERGEPRPTGPFLDLRLQLWQRELRRMVATVGERPRLRHGMDLQPEERERHLPLVHCRGCGAMGWATLVPRDKPHQLKIPELQAFYRAYFGADPRVTFLFPAAARRDPTTWKGDAFRVEGDTLTRLAAGATTEAKTVELVAAPNVRSAPTGARLSRDCPFCGARDILSIVGFQAATLTSLYIDQLFASPFNDDKKLLTFSDNVQDAAHRAGFFGTRTWRINLRLAIHAVIRDHGHHREGGPEGPGGPLTLAALADHIGAYWRQRLDPVTWTATFLAPNMTWLQEWEAVKQQGQVPAGSELERLIDERLAFEVQHEFGLQSEIGRSLPRTGSAVAHLALERLEKAVASLVEVLRNEVPGLRRVSEEAVRRFVVGLLHQLRRRGGILARSLPARYLESGGRDTFVFKQSKSLPAMGRSASLPALLTERQLSQRFDTWGGQGDGGWYSRWVSICFGGEALHADAASVYPVVLPVLVAAGLLGERLGQKNERIWGLREDALIISPEVLTLACDQCRRRVWVAPVERPLWLGMPCSMRACRGSFADDPRPLDDYFGRLYRAGDLRRIFAEEHTGLLDRSERERVETEFKAREGAADDPLARRPWYTNLLSCTPTLEMGIDIGDLSTVVLCTVPPGQANYLQRVGRAGRRDGNALALTVAGANHHDLYFFAEPRDMMEGAIEPPGIFLDAPAVLERQMTAFCFDRWVAASEGQVDLPPTLRTVFAHLGSGGSGDGGSEAEGARRFPFNFVEFVRAAQPTLLREFNEMFDGAISDDTEDHLRRFLIGDGDSVQPELHHRILRALEQERKQRDSQAAQARELRARIKAMKAREARPEDFEQQVEELEAEKDALLAVVAGINKRHTLEFLTDEGLLPNYAFPESPVRLNSVIWRKKQKPPEKGSSYDIWRYEYKRSPSSALAELAPGSDFYAGGRRVRIDQVDIGSSEVESWRFCAECHHGQRDSSDSGPSCPACGSSSWRDDGQKYRLLQLRQVVANAPDRDSRIRDDAENRTPRFFERQMMVEVDDAYRVGAWHIDDPTSPFGFEYLKRATFRDINFGEAAEFGARSTIAGHETVRPGFEICARCGKVQERQRRASKGETDAGKGGGQHTLGCPTRKDGVAEKIESCLYLYREFSSEALRLLLPMGDVATARRLNSFVAALQLGLREFFSGSVEHLKTTLYSEPSRDSSLRRQFLVLYDTVPGGTGYLKQLVTPRQEGGEPPLLDLLQRALESIESCVCWDDPERNGCYRCVYVYRNSRDHEDTSASLAAEILRQILDRRGKLETIKSLGEVSISGLLDSELEARFLEALRLIKTADGREARLRTAFLNGKSGHRLILGEAEWLIEPQVEPEAAETGGVKTSIDFVMRSASTESRRRLAVFLDGFAYHRNRVAQDLRQRMALIASGWEVWTFTWGDLESKLNDRVHTVPELLIQNIDAFRGALQRTGIPGFDWLVEEPIFTAFERELRGEELPWEGIAHAALASRLAGDEDGDAERWPSFVERVAPAAARRDLLAMKPCLLAVDAGETSAFFELMAVYDGNQVAVLCTLDDRPEHQDTPEFKAAWHGYLRLFQLLSRAKNAWFMTHLGSLESDLYEPIALTQSGTPGELSWPEAGEIGADYRALAERLMDAGVRQPEIGMELPDARGYTWAEAELLWDEEGVAVTSKVDSADAAGQAASHYTVFYLEDLGDDPAPIIAALSAARADDGT